MTAPLKHSDPVNVDVALKISRVATVPPMWPPARERTVRVSSLAALRANLVEQLGPKTPVPRGTISVTIPNGQR